LPLTIAPTIQAAGLISPALTLVVALLAMVLGAAGIVQARRDRAVWRLVAAPVGPPWHVWWPSTLGSWFWSSPSSRSDVDGPGTLGTVAVGRPSGTHRVQRDTAVVRKRPEAERCRSVFSVATWRGRRHEGFEELIEFRAVDKESEKSWTRLLTDLERRGLRRTNRWGQKLEMIGCDGDAGLREALWMVYPTVPKQRCVVHKVRDIQQHLQDQAHGGQIMPEASAIYDDLFSPQQAKRRLELWGKRRHGREPDAVRCFCYEFEDTLTYLNAPVEDHSRLRTNNPAERFVRELEKKFGPAAVWPNDRSWGRTTYLVWSQLRTQGYAPTRPPRASPPFTHTS
jgi:hypothetical protein